MSGAPPLDECLPFEHGVALSVSSAGEQTNVTVATLSERAQQVALAALRDYLARFHSQVREPMWRGSVVLFHVLLSLYDL